MNKNLSEFEIVTKNYIYLSSRKCSIEQSIHVFLKNKEIKIKCEFRVPNWEKNLAVGSKEYMTARIC